MVGRWLQLTLTAAFLMGGVSLPARAQQADLEGGTHGGRNPRVYQTADMVEFGNPTNLLGGAATLFRSPHSLDATVATSGLDPNAAYTVWWVVFNNPRDCVEGCGGDDLARPEVRASVFYATGFLTANQGTANATAHLKAGPLPQGVDVVLGHGLERKNGLRAEIHVVVRSHGPIIPGMVAKQISTFDPGCTVCQDQQAAAFQPVR